MEPAKRGGATQTPWGLVDPARRAPTEAQAELFETLVESVPVPLAVVRIADSIVLYANESFGELVGVPKALLLGRSSERFRTDLAGRQAALAELERTGVLRNREMCGSKADGSATWGVVSARLATLDGERVAFLGVYETTERRQVEERVRQSEARLAEAQRISRIGSWEWDIEADRIAWSDEMCRIYGMAPGAFDGSYQVYLDRQHPDDRDRTRCVVEEARRTGQPFQFRHRIVWPDGRVRTLHGRGRVVVDAAGRPVRMMGTSQDVTQQVEMEEILARRTRDLQRSNEELQQFAYVASHDLQEPLRKIQTFTDRLQQLLSDRVDAKSADYLGRLHDAAARMQRLITDLLQLSRVTTKGQELCAVDLGETVRNALQDLEVAIEKSGARIEVGAMPTVHADATQMRQLFLNLLSNAIKFRKAGQAPSVRIHSEPVAVLGGRTTHHVIRVTDDGVGFDPVHAERIFSVFQRLHGRDEYEGTGIGLAICRKIVDRHGGHILAEGTPGGGATFTVTLPAGPHAGAGPGDGPPGG